MSYWNVFLIWFNPPFTFFLLPYFIAKINFHLWKTFLHKHFIGLHPFKWLSFPKFSFLCGFTLNVIFLTKTFISLSFSCVYYFWRPLQPLCCFYFWHDGVLMVTPIYLARFSVKAMLLTSALKLLWQQATFYPTLSAVFPDHQMAFYFCAICTLYPCIQATGLCLTLIPLALNCFALFFH